MKNWIERLNALAAGLLFDGGYVVDPTRRADPPPADAASLAGCEPRQANDAPCAPRRPSTRLAVG